MQPVIFAENKAILRQHAQNFKTVRFQKTELGQDLRSQSIPPQVSGTQLQNNQPNQTYLNSVMATSATSVKAKIWKTRFPARKKWNSSLSTH